MYATIYHQLSAINRLRQLGSSRVGASFDGAHLAPGFRWRAAAQVDVVPHSEVEGRWVARERGELQQELHLQPVFLDGARVEAVLDSET